jgi:hypothetical protein
MATDVDLVNQALGIIGQDRITALTNASKVAETCKLFLPRVKQATLRARDWNCARKRAVLDPVTNNSQGEWLYAYQLPPDCLAFRRFVEPRWRGERRGGVFAVEQRILFTNNSTAKVVYTFDLVDVNRWDSMLFDAAATRLASELAGPIARDFTIAQKTFQMYVAKIEEAQGVDEQESEFEEERTATLNEVRRGGGWSW